MNNQGFTSAKVRLPFSSRHSLETVTDLGISLQGCRRHLRVLIDEYQKYSSAKKKATSIPSRLKLSAKADDLEAVRHPNEASLNAALTSLLLPGIARSGNPIDLLWTCL